MKMYFYYGVMGSSKTANALMTHFNWIDKGMKVALIKPATDTRDGAKIVKSRAGIQAEALVLPPDMTVGELLPDPVDTYDNIIVDEAQFLTPAQVEELRDFVDGGKCFVMCYGLKTDFMTRTFPGSQRLLELADSIREVVSMCPCGKKAIINARFMGNKILYEGEQVAIGGNESYIALCHSCYKKGKISKKQADFTVPKD